jgi:PadR family transcriptional regulator, regulatory protein PadR
MGDVPGRNPDLLRGTVELLILKALTRGRQHGFGIARWPQDVTDDVLRLEEGSLYPALHRMERRGWLQAEWGISDNNRQVKFYRLTRGGREYLQRESSGWTEFATAVFKVLRTT